MKLLQTLNPENVDEADTRKYQAREAARAVLIDRHNLIALLFVSQENYYKLPGGGVEKGESPEEALRRECFEETGCEIKVIEELGKIIEWRKFCSLKQISYCYVARIQGEKNAPQFDDGEIADGFELLWVPYQQAIRLITQKTASTIEGLEYISVRDTRILLEAKRFL